MKVPFLKVDAKISFQEPSLRFFVSCISFFFQISSHIDIDKDEWLWAYGSVATRCFTNASTIEFAINVIKYYTGIGKIKLYFNFSESFFERNTFLWRQRNRIVGRGHPQTEVKIVLKRPPS